MSTYFGVPISNEGMHNDFTCIVLRIKSILYTVTLRALSYVLLEGNSIIDLLFFLDPLIESKFLGNSQSSSSLNTFVLLKVADGPLVTLRI